MRAGVIIAGVFAVGVAAIFFVNMGGDPAPAPTPGAVAAAPEVKAKNIFVAAQPIPIGTVVTQDMLAVQPWPEHLVLDGFIGADDGSKDAVGFVARAPFQPQEPIIRSKLANPSDPNFLAGELPKGMRVVTIITNETEGVAGFLFPGDHVDVILTHDIEKLRHNPLDPAESVQIKEDTISETILTNVKVMAVDQRASGANNVDSEGKLMVPRSVSLMVSQGDAQRLRLGQKIGTLTLALRSLADRDSADPLTITNTRDISQYEVGGVEKGGAEIKIYRGAPKQSTPASEEPASAAPRIIQAPNTHNQQTMGQQ